MRKNYSELLAATLMLLMLPMQMPATNQKATATQSGFTSSNTTGYGVPTADSVRFCMERVLRYIDKAVPAQFYDNRTGQTVTDFSRINADTRMRAGDFRPYSYEWGVTYCATLTAGQLLGDTAYTRYADNRLMLLAQAAPALDKARRIKGYSDKQVSRVLAPHSLDDSGAMCLAFIKLYEQKRQAGTLTDDEQKAIDGLVSRLSDCVLHRQKHMPDGIYCRNFPMRNSVWTDDMFMGVPATAWLGRYTGDTAYFDRALHMVELYRRYMFVEEQGLFRHGWVEEMQEHRVFPWGRANGWALLTLCEVLDALPDGYPGRDRVLELLRLHIQTLAELQDANGFWHQLLNRPATFAETSATAIFTYCMAHAINEGWIDAASYGPQTLLGWHAVSSMVTSDGHVEGTVVGSGIGFDPSFYQHRRQSSTAAHGYGPVIWAGAEIVRLLQTQYPKVNDGAVHFFDHAIDSTESIFRVE